MPTALHHILQTCQQSWQPASPAVCALTNEILARHGNTCQAVLFYGSCLRKGDDSGGIVDLYLLVDSYRSIYSNRLLSFANKLLPPNVFYLELPFKGRMVRAKYAVLALADFQRGTSLHCFHSYFWARFAQPASLLYARTEQVATQVRAALGQAVMTFITRVLPQLRDCFTAEDLWREGFLLSYRAEFRAERPDNLVSLFDVWSEHYEQLTRAAVALVPFPIKVLANADPVRYHACIPARVRHHSYLQWRVRCLQGKLLSVLRLLKGLFTFQGGLDYVLWKIERHSGIAIKVTPRLRRYPLLAVCVLFWRSYRRGAFR
jgi:hypothetical protein